MSRIPIINDTHFGSRGDSQVIYQNQEEFYTKIFWPAIDAEGGVDTILHLRDVTDRRKFVAYQTLSFAKHMFFEPARERGITIHWALGNHDMPYKNSQQLSSHEAFREYDNLIVYRTATQLVVDDVPVLFVPWLCDENMKSSLDAIRNFDGGVVMGHFEFGNFEMFRGVPNIHGMSIDDFLHFNLVLSGHYHHKSSQGNIHYLGAPYEMIWSDADDARGFHWWTPQTHAIEFVENPHRLFYKFTYDDADQPGSYVQSLLDRMKAANITQKIVKVVVKQKTNAIWYDTFADAALKLGAHDLQFVDDTAWAQEDFASVDHDHDLDTQTLILRYIESLPWANTQIQRHVSVLMSELYQEATDRAKTLSRV